MALTPQMAQQFQRAGALMAQQRFGEALDLLDALQRQTPRHVHIACRRAACMAGLSRTADALAVMHAVLRQRPDLPGPYLTLGDILYHAGRQAEALEVYDRAPPPGDDDPRLQERRARALSALKRYDEAQEACEAALAIDPAQVAMRVLQGALLVLRRRHHEAIALLRALTADHPDTPEGFMNLGVALTDCGDPHAAIPLFQRVLELDPSLVSARVNLAAALLKSGALAEGWRAYERRGGGRSELRKAGIHRPPWLGQTPIAGRTILVEAELGLGDTLQFCRYLPMLEQAGARVLFAPQPPLTALMRTLSPTLELVKSADIAGLSFDEHCRLLSLPLAFGITADTIPAAHRPYLAADPARIARWRARLGDQGLRIGVCWKGSDVRSGRAFPLAALAGIASIPGVRLISLQTGPAAQDAPPPGMALETLGPDFDTGPDAFLDAAAVIEHCDLVITTDTSIGHLAGALGRETWIPLNLDCCWRWLLNRDDSPWYPRHRLFRQTAMDDWAPVFARMEAALRTRVAQI